MLIEEKNTWHETGYAPVVPENLFRQEVKLTWKQRKILSTQARDKALKEYNEKYHTQDI